MEEEYNWLQDLREGLLYSAFLEHLVRISAESLIRFWAVSLPSRSSFKRSSSCRMLSSFVQSKCLKSCLILYCLHLPGSIICSINVTLAKLSKESSRSGLLVYRAKNNWRDCGCMSVFGCFTTDSSHKTKIGLLGIYSKQRWGTLKYSISMMSYLGNLMRSSFKV